MSNIIQTFPKGGSPTYAGLPDKPTVNNIDIEALSIEGMDVVEDTTNNVTEISASGLNADSIADVLSGDIANYAVTSGNTYSTSEQIVGKWIDGKPVYQKTILDSFGANVTNTKIVFNFTYNIDTVISLNAMTNYTGPGTSSSTSNYWQPLTMINNDIQYCSKVWVEVENTTSHNCNLLLYNTNSVLINKPVICTVLYTKTTDT